MDDILAQSLASLSAARTAVLESMKNRYPVGSEVSWRAGKGFSTGHVIGHAPFWTREPTRLWVKSIRNGKTKWVTPYNIPTPIHAAPPAQAVDLDKLRALADRWATDRSYSGSPADDLRAWIDSQAVGNG